MPKGNAMQMRRQYRSTGIPVSAVESVVDFISAGRSRQLGEAWGHNRREYRLFYESEEIVCDGLDEMKAAVVASGDTLRYMVDYKSRTGRLVRIDATDGTRIVVEVGNASRTLPLSRSSKTSPSAL